MMNRSFPRSGNPAKEKMAAGRDAHCAAKTGSPRPKGQAEQEDTTLIEPNCGGGLDPRRRHPYIVAMRLCPAFAVLLGVMLPGGGALAEQPPPAPMQAVPAQAAPGDGTPLCLLVGSTARPN